MYRRAAGLLALADSNYPAACEYYRQMIARDSTDFTGWFGLGECQRMDPIVITKASGPTRYGFRASLFSAQSAYLKALRLVPLSHRAFHDVLFPRLLEVFPTSAWLRSGILGSDNRQEFLAWPEREADTSAFHPQPYALFTGQHPPPRPKSMVSEFQRNRAVLGSVVSGWVERFPSSPIAWQAQAVVLELFERSATDSTGALGAINRAMSLHPDSATAIALRIAQARLYLKVGQYASAAKSARSALLASRGARGELALRLAPLAALTGQTALCVELLRSGAGKWGFTSADGSILRPPEDLATDALAYYGYAVMGAPADSIRVLERRVVDGINGWAPIQSRPDAITGLMETPAYYAFPVVGPSTAHLMSGHGASLELQVRIARGDLSVARGSVEAELALADSSDAGELPPESAYLLAENLLAVGDSAAAASMLTRTLQSLRLQDHLLMLPQSSGFLLRAFRLRQRLAPTWVPQALARADSVALAQLLEVP
jgi:tetratricopeptide (TPR) repeat protein